MQQISVARLFDGQNWQQNVTLTIKASHIDSIQPATGPVLSGSLVPGFIDVQVNGSGGALFNTDTSIEALRTMVVGSSPTLSTISLDYASINRSISIVRLVRATRLASVVSAAYKTPEMIGLSEIKITVTKSTSSCASKCTTNHYLYCMWLS